MSDSKDLGKNRQTKPVNPPAAPDRWRGASNVIEWLVHLAHDRVIPNWREFLDERQPLVWAVALVIGIGAAYFALLFRSLIGLVQLPWLGTTNENVYAAATQTPWWVILMAPAIGGLAVGLFLQFFMPGRRSHGVADVIEARALFGCRIPAQTGLGSALVSAVSLGAGASAGREGPVVHLGATLASVLMDLFKFSHVARRTLLACGVAAAVSASFNAPIAGVLFAHEVILAHYAIRAFVPIVISSVVATVIARIHFGDFPAFFIPDYTITSYWEFPAFALLGLTCAGVAIAFQFSVVASDRIAESVDVPLWTRPVIGGLLVGGIAIWFPQVLGVGYAATDAALKEQFPLYLLLVLLVLKTIATAITLASRFGGGVFSPSLYLGAMCGGAFGIIAASFFPEISSSLSIYAIIGMGAVAAAVLGAPISTTLIVFELTGGYEMTIALLLAISVSTGLTYAVHGQSFFHYLLSTRGVFLKEGPHKHIVRSLKVREFMIAVTSEEAQAIQGVENNPDWLTPDDSLEAALRAFDRTGQQRIPVVDSADTSKLKGWVEHLDALNAFNDALIEASEEEHK
ncbi:MAG: chloride channel protein [Alphaproteobacteria bacterium]